MCKKYFTKLRSIVISVVIAFSVICSSYLTSYDVQAAGLVNSIRDKLAYYVLTVTGAVNAGVNGVSQATSSAMSALQEKIADLWGNGIYQDASGNYVFSGTASKELLETIMGQTNLNARVISSFPGATPYGGLFGTDSPYFNPQVKSFANSGRSLYTDYIAVVEFRNDSNYYYSKIGFMDLSNVAYLVTDYSSSGFYRIRFYDANGSSVTVHFSYKDGNYNISNGNFSTPNISPNEDTISQFQIRLNSIGYGSNTFINNIYYSSYPLDLDSSTAFNAFPYYANNTSLCWSNKSIIIGLDSAYGQAEANKQSGIFVSNTYNIIPTVSSTVIENNNWQKIYNDYVQNVNNESNTYITNETLDPTALRKVMKKYTKVITDAIDEGVTDIENAISTTNEWLKKIYERLGEISVKLDNLGGDSSGGESGGSSDCPWTVEDIETITDALDRIDANLASELTEMQRTYTLLGQILSAINNIEVDGGRDITTIIPILVSLPDSDVLDYIDTGDVLADLMSSVVPFCFVGFALGLCDTLSAQPVTPRWVIPLRLNSSTTGLNVDEEIVIDFADYEQSGFGFIHDLLIAGQCILFILALIWLTFNLLESFNLIFG